MELMKHKHRCTVCDQGLNHREILEFVNQQDMVIGTRLHSLILAIVTRTPVIAVSYHHKVKDFMDAIDCEDYVILIEDIRGEKEFFLQTYRKMRKNWDTVLNRFETIASTMTENEPKGTTLLEKNDIFRQ
ncbi:polysaccharide pyruvyl transferase family protein [Tigheibacillus jepli]